MINFLFFTFNRTTAFLEAAILNHFFRNSAQTTQDSYMGLITRYVGSTWAEFSDASSWEMSASSNPGYARQRVDWSEPNSQSIMHNLNTIAFSASSDWLWRIKGYQIFTTAAEGTGDSTMTHNWEGGQIENWGINILSGSENYEISPGDINVSWVYQPLVSPPGTISEQSFTRTTPYLSNRVLNHFYRTGSIPAHDGRYLGFFNVAPSWGDMSSGFVDGRVGYTYVAGSEVSADSYSRQIINWSIPVNSGFPTYVRNTNVIEVIPPEDWGPFGGIGIWDSPTGGNLLLFSVKDDLPSLDKGVPLRFPINSIELLGQ